MRNLTRHGLASLREDTVEVDPRTAAPASLTFFTCQCGGHGEFTIGAPNIGIAWVVAMDRYGAEYPNDLPSPRVMRPHARSLTGEIGDFREEPTKPADLGPMARMTKALR